jgi:hypothetical protein
MKKIFIISLVLLGVVLFFLGVYNFAFKKNTNPATPAASSDAQKPTAPKTSAKLAAVSDQAVLGPVFDKKSETLTYYAAKDGTVWTSDADGNGKRQTAGTPLPGLKNVFWSADRSKVLTMFEKNGQTSFFEYNYPTKKGVPLKNGLDTAVWDNLGVKIFYKYFDAKTKTRTLNVANADGSGWQKIADVPFKDVSIAPVPLTSTVSFWNAPDANTETWLQTVGAAGGQPQTILRGRYGADYLWSPDGTQALVSSLANQGDKMVKLGLVTLTGKYSDLDIPTFVSKCVWSADGKTLYYALPGGITNGAVIPNDYLNNKFFTDDTFWKMDIGTGEKSRIINASDINGKYDSSNPFLSATQDALYFVNKVDGKLYKIAL